MGQRYYDSIIQLQHVKIHIYDPLLKNNTDYENILNNLEVNFIIDLAIIATCADVRFEVTNNLISKNKNIKNILFEKFLFLKKTHYIKIEKLLILNKINAWVNCTRRLYDCYDYIKNKLGDGNDIKMIVIGEEWGLCSNSIHFIDIYHYLSKNSIGNLHIKNTEIIKSKRDGFYDMLGHIYTNDNKLNIICVPKTNNNVIFAKKIWNKEYVFVILNYDNILHLVEHNIKNNKFNTRTFKMPFLSEIAKNFVENILNDKKINLPTFTESMKYHLKLLKLFSNQFIKNNIDIKFT